LETKLKHLHRKHPLWARLAFYGFGLASLLWLVFRSGPKPSRLAYPCQRAAASYSLGFLTAIWPLFGATFLSGKLNRLSAQNQFAIEGRVKLLKLLKIGLILSPFLLFPLNGSAGAISPGAITNPVPAVDEKTVKLPNFPNPNPIVALAHLDHTPNEAEIAAMVTQSVDGALGAGGLKNLVMAGDKVLIKPNLGCGYNAHETTDWRVVKPIVLMAKQAGASQVFIAEGEGCSYGDSIFSLSGYAANIPDVTYINFNSININPYYNVTVAGGLWDQAIAIPQVYFDADVVISVPKLKTHNAGGVTLSLKNAVGVPPVPLYSRPGDTYRTLLHDNFEIRKSIVQINLARTPDFGVIDGILAGQGEGPWAASPIEMDTILAGKDLVALDAVGATIMGIDPARIPYLVYASDKNLGILDEGSIQIVGATAAAVKKDFALPSVGPFIYRKAYVIHKTPSPVQIDASSLDWTPTGFIRLNKMSDIVSGSGNWSGPQDLSLESRLLYDQDALYALVKVQDNQKIDNPAPLQMPPAGDTLELDVSMSDPWYRLEDPVYSDNDFRFLVGYGSNPVVWDLRRGKIVPAAVVKIADAADGYTLEIKIPFAELNHFLPAENSQIGLDLAVMDVDNGSGPKEMAWNSATSLHDDARRMGVSLLGSEAGCANPHFPCIYLPIIKGAVTNAIQANH